MRILYVSHSFPLPDQPLSNVGGMQRVAVDLHRALGAHPEVELHSALLQTSWQQTGLRTPPFLLKLSGTLPSLVRRHRIEVVLFSSMVTASVLTLLRGRLSAAGAITAAIPVGRDVTLPNPVYQRFVPSVLSRLDLVFPISRATAAACLDRGAEPSRVHVVPCGVDLERLGELRRRAETRAILLDRLRSKGLSIDPDALLLLSVGRHQERKGFHWFIDQVMPRLGPDVFYLLAGSGPKTPAIRERVTARKLDDRVALLGQVDEDLLRLLYAGTDLFVMPNIPVPGDIEGFGVVMLEAGAAGAPVVAAELEGIRDVITEGENGTLVESGNAQAFVDAIRRYRDPPVLERASARARDHVTERFGWSGVANQFVEILRARLAL